ncbi:hypothetical protein KM043_016780 [Ampulex compressa]|nr:hypothetical protein KM043_016780 [Ampulex compressa]
MIIPRPACVLNLLVLYQRPFPLRIRTSTMRRTITRARFTGIPEPVRGKTTAWRDIGVRWKSSRKKKRIEQQVVGPSLEKPVRRMQRKEARCALVIRRESNVPFKSTVNIDEEIHVAHCDSRTD